MVVKYKLVQTKICLNFDYTESIYLYFKQVYSYWETFFLIFTLQAPQHLSTEPGRHERVLSLLPGRRSELARGPAQAGQTERQIWSHLSRRSVEAKRTLLVKKPIYTNNLFKIRRIGTTQHSNNIIYELIVKHYLNNFVLLSFFK